VAPHRRIQLYFLIPELGRISLLLPMYGGMHRLRVNYLYACSLYEGTHQTRLIMWTPEDWDRDTLLPDEHIDWARKSPPSHNSRERRPPCPQKDKPSGPPGPYFFNIYFDKLASAILPCSYYFRQQAKDRRISPSSRLFKQSRTSQSSTFLSIYWTRPGSASENQEGVAIEPSNTVPTSDFILPL